MGDAHTPAQIALLTTHGQRKTSGNVPHRARCPKIDCRHAKRVWLRKRSRHRASTNGHRADACSAQRQV